jgi:hypothetical protein
MTAELQTDGRAPFGWARRGPCAEAQRTALLFLLTHLSRHGGGGVRIQDAREYLLAGDNDAVVADLLYSEDDEVRGAWRAFASFGPRVTHQLLDCAAELLEGAPDGFVPHWHIPALVTG